MKKVNTIGKVVFAIGILNLFRKIDGFYGYGGYVDNTFEILFTSLILITTGVIMIFVSRKRIKN